MLTSETLMKHLLKNLQESGHTTSDSPRLAVSTVRAENESSLWYLHLGFLQFNLKQNLVRLPFAFMLFKLLQC